MNKIGSILESLNYNRYKKEIISEAVKVEYDNASKMKKSSRVIRKTFGKIMSPKETWYDMSELIKCVDSEDSPFKSNYRSKFFNINTSYEGFPVEETLELLRKIKNIPYERILKILYKVSKERFHIEQMSNLRMVFQSDRNRNHRVELRFDRKLFNKDSGRDENDFNDEDLAEEISINDRAMKTASTHKDSDFKESEKMKKIVEETMTNEVRPFKKEKINEAEIQKKSGAGPEISKASAVIANDLFESSFREEPNITRDIVSIVKKLGGKMYGLDFRLKQPTSLGRKIADDAVHDEKLKGDVNKAASGIKDTVRYTVIYGLDDFTEKYFSTKRALEELGYVETRCKNFYTQYAKKESQQKAIQCVYFKKPDGILFEFQFHTVESQGVKDVNHFMYDEYRDKSTPLERQIELDIRMKELSSTVPDPVGVFSIPEHS